MKDNADKTVCDGLDKILYENRCPNCEGHGWYNLEGREHPKLICDYYEDFLKRCNQTETQQLPKPRNTDTKATTRMKRFDG